MDGHDESRLILGKPCRRYAADTAVLTDEPGQERAVRWIREQNPDVAIVKSQLIIVLRNENRHARVSVLRSADQSLFTKNFLDRSVQALYPVWSGPQRAQHSELLKFFERLGWIGRAQIGGVTGNDPLAQSLRDLQWGRCSSGHDVWVITGI